MEQQSSIFVLIGPSGSGKNTIMNAVLRGQHPDRLRQLPTATTRPKRHYETEGVEHFFVSHEAFEQLIADGALIEYQRIHGAGYYGTPRAAIDETIAQGYDLIADIDIYGAQALKQAYPQQVVLIFISPPSPHSLEARIRQRQTDDDQQIKTRLERVTLEMTYALRADYLIVNDDLDSAIQLVQQVVVARRNRCSLEAQIPLRARAWITQKGDSNQVMVTQEGLPCFQVEDPNSAAATVTHLLHCQHGVEVAPVGQNPCQAVWVYYQGGELVAEVFVPLPAQHVPEHLKPLWAAPTKLDLPFHIRAAVGLAC